MDMEQVNEEQFEEQFKKQDKECIKQTLKQTQEKKQNPWSSKLGGKVYLREGDEYPVNDEGDGLQQQAQINFSEMPRLTNFPTSGQQQYFINPWSVMFGQDEKKGYCVRYYEEEEQKNLIPYEERFVFIKNEEGLQIKDITTTKVALYNSPLHPAVVCSITGTYDISHISPSDYIWEEEGSEYKKMYDSDIDGQYKYFEEYDEQVKHQLGGNPTLSQIDVRTDKDYREYILLFQLVSDQQKIDTSLYDRYTNLGIDETILVWGDLGEGGFYIHPDDLVAKNFSNVLYYWSCP